MGMLYLMGMQNTPDVKSWNAYQPTREEYVVEFYYHDQTAMISVELFEDKITIDRIGTSPSTSYSMQETVIVEGILDELEKIAMEGDCAEENRLIVFRDENAIATARDGLSFA